MKEIWTLGETLCEIMRTDLDVGLKQAGFFKGPYASGAPSIFIDAVAKLGYPCGLFATTGNDEFGECAREKLQKDGVNCSYMQINDELSTGVAFVAYKSNGDRRFLYHIGNAAAGKIVIPEKMPDNVGVFHVMGCAMMPSLEMAGGILHCVKYYHDKGAVISFDPNIRVESLKNQNLTELIKPVMEVCSILLPGVEELLAVTGCTELEEAIAYTFRTYPNIEIIVLKNGGKSCRIITRDNDFSVDTCKVKVVDSTGAGDCFDAGFLTSWLDGKSLLECAHIACAAGALNCAAFGPMEGNISPDSVATMVAENYCV